MNKSIYMFWHSKKNHFNFGDDINPYIIENLSGKKVKRVMVFRKKRNIILNLVKITRGIAIGRYTFSAYIEYIRSFTNPDYIVCIGSILQNGFSEKAKIWGSGIIHSKSEVNQSKFYAVRGLKTKERINHLGYTFDGTIGDPAILLPIVFNPHINKSNKIGVIPHVIHYSDSVKKFNDNKYMLIDLSEPNIEKTIKLIKSCRYVISSSLHGIIVSHAYNVPALCIQLDKELAGDGIKFLDYYSSVGIKDYEPLKLNDSCFLSVKYFEDLFDEMKNYALPNVEVVSKIQKDLLSVAPFELCEKYKFDI